MITRSKTRGSKRTKKYRQETTRKSTKKSASESPAKAKRRKKSVRSASEKRVESPSYDSSDENLHDYFFEDAASSPPSSPSPLSPQVTVPVSATRKRMSRREGRKNLLSSRLLYYYGVGDTQNDSRPSDPKETKLKSGSVMEKQDAALILADLIGDPSFLPKNDDDTLFPPTLPSLLDPEKGCRQKTHVSIANYIYNMKIYDCMKSLTPENREFVMKFLFPSSLDPTRHSKVISSDPKYTGPNYANQSQSPFIYQDFGTNYGSTGNGYGTEHWNQAPSSSHYSPMSAYDPTTDMPVDPSVAQNPISVKLPVPIREHFSKLLHNQLSLLQQCGQLCPSQLVQMAAQINAQAKIAAQAQAVAQQVSQFSKQAPLIVQQNQSSKSNAAARNFIRRKQQQGKITSEEALNRKKQQQMQFDYVIKAANPPNKYKYPKKPRKPNKDLPKADGSADSGLGVHSYYQTTPNISVASQPPLIVPRVQNVNQAALLQAQMSRSNLPYSNATLPLNSLPQLHSQIKWQNSFESGNELQPRAIQQQAGYAGGIQASVPQGPQQHQQGPQQNHNQTGSEPQDSTGMGGGGGQQQQQQQQQQSGYQTGQMGQMAGQVGYQSGAQKKGPITTQFISEPYPFLSSSSSSLSGSSSSLPNSSSYSNSPPSSSSSSFSSAPSYPSPSSSSFSSPSYSSASSYSSAPSSSFSTSSYSSSSFSSPAYSSSSSFSLNPPPSSPFDTSSPSSFSLPIPTSTNNGNDPLLAPRAMNTPQYQMYHPPSSKDQNLHPELENEPLLPRNPTTRHPVDLQHQMYELHQLHQQTTKTRAQLGKQQPLHNSANSYYGGSNNSSNSSDPQDGSMSYQASGFQENRPRKQQQGQVPKEQQQTKQQQYHSSSSLYSSSYQQQQQPLSQRSAPQQQHSSQQHHQHANQHISQHS